MNQGLLSVFRLVLLVIAFILVLDGTTKIPKHETYSELLSNGWFLSSAGTVIALADATWLKNLGKKKAPD